MKKLRCFFLITFTFVFANSAIATDTACDPCRKPTSWMEFNAFTLKVSRPEKTDYDLWHGQMDKDSNDIQIDANSLHNNLKKSGTILMVSGRVMAIKGEVGNPGYEMDALDAPILYQQLVLRLLGAALPDGTKGLKGSNKIDFSDAKTGIQFATPSAQGFISPPWSVKGNVTMIAADVVEYDLSLTSGNKGTPDKRGTWFEAKFSGRLSNSSNAKISDSMSLKGWKLFGVGVQTKKTDNGTTYDYTSAPSTDTYKTVKDIRMKLDADNFPGKPDSTKDFTGFWKSKCEDGFGLQIMHYGNDGKYSIAFCGPGGCGDIGDSRKSFITGDKNFEVISEDEIAEIGRSGERDKSIRCSKDPYLKLR